MEFETEDEIYSKWSDSPFINTPKAIIKSGFLLFDGKRKSGSQLPVS